MSAINIVANRIQQDKQRIFKMHPRQVTIQFNSNWYNAIRVAQLRDGLDMTFDGYNPDTDTVFKVNRQEFLGADGETEVVPKKNEEIRAENINWRIQDVTIEDDDVRLLCRKRLTTA